MSALQSPPLALYVHVPWCVQKCPYCDFNSHAQQGELPQERYLDALLADLDADLQQLTRLRPLSSIFIGGGTPSLLYPETIAALLNGIRQRIPFIDDIEITMEANPGTVEAGRFAAFHDAGVNRISIGVQSFASDKLARLGRIHGAEEAIAAAGQAASASLRSFNLDLMHGLPQQTLSEALADLRQAIALAPPHLSWYQLTIEPNTLFGSHPPSLPDDDLLWDIDEQGRALLTAAGYQRYEVSAYARAPEYQCRHNLNYWTFGDYLGVGCGAHGKITQAENGQIIRTEKIRHPKGYLEPGRDPLLRSRQVSEDERPFEYMMNRARLLAPAPYQEFTDRTGLSWQALQPTMEHQAQRGLVHLADQHWQMTELGLRYLNTFLQPWVD